MSLVRNYKSVLRQRVGSQSGYAGRLLTRHLLKALLTGEQLKSMQTFMVDAPGKAQARCLRGAALCHIGSAPDPSPAVLWCSAAMPHRFAEEGRAGGSEALR
jgi:hypothetical protein